VTVLAACPGCGSALLQPLRSRSAAAGGLIVELRCPECFAWMEESCTREELAALDRLQAATRELLVDAYERSVAESMEALADCLVAALARDLVTADDFRPVGAARSRAARPGP
jgi:hypothetical protein